MTKTPWWFWLIAVVAVLWNAGGAFDYVMCQTENEAYLAEAAKTSPDAVAWLAEMPAWRVALWAFAVWGSVAASLLLLLRRGLALTAYGFSLAFILLGLFMDIAVLGVGNLYAGSQAIFTGAIVLATIAQFWFAKRMRRSGVLR